MTDGWEQALEIASCALPARQWRLALASALCEADKVVSARVSMCPPDDLAHAEVAVWPRGDAAYDLVELLRSSQGRVLGSLSVRLAQPCTTPLAQIAGIAAHTLETALDLAAACGPRQAALAELSPRQREIAELVCAGMSDLNIAVHLSITEATVGTHLSHIFRKLRVHNRVDLLRKIGGL